MAFLAGVAIAASLLSSSATGAATERPDGVRRCATRAEAPGRITPRVDDLRIGPVLFFGLGRTPSLQHVRGNDPSLKAAIAVRAGGPILIRIPREARGRIALQYAARRDGSTPSAEHVRDGQHLVLVHPCPPDTRRFSDGRRLGPWTAYPGGFVMRAAGCYPIEVARRGKPFKRRMIGFGKPCAQKS